MKPNHLAVVGAILWLARDMDSLFPSPMCAIERLRKWSSRCERCEFAQLRADLEFVIRAGFVRWYMPGMVALTPAGERVARDVLARCEA